MHITRFEPHRFIDNNGWSDDEPDDTSVLSQQPNRSFNQMTPQRNTSLTPLGKAVRKGASTAKHIYAFGRKVTPVVSAVCQFTSALYISTHYMLPWANTVCNNSSNLSHEYALQCSSSEVTNQASAILLHSSCVLAVSFAYKCSKSIINRSIKKMINVSNCVFNMGKNIYRHFYPIHHFYGKGFHDYLPPKPVKVKSNFEKFEDHISSIPRHELEQELKNLYVLSYSEPLGRAIPANEVDPELLFRRQASRAVRICSLKRKIGKAT